MKCDKMIAELRSGSPNERLAASRDLARSSDPCAVDALMDALGDGNWAIRSNAAYSLGELRAARAVPVLVKALSDPVERVRKSAAKALGMIGQRGVSVKALEGALMDSSGSVRRSAARSLGQIGDPSARQALEASLSDPDTSVSAMARNTLSKLPG